MQQQPIEELAQILSSGCARTIQNSFSKLRKPKQSLVGNQQKVVQLYNKETHQFFQENHAEK